MKSKKITDIIHFYYCIITAIKIAKKYGDIKSAVGVNVFTIQWLSAARKNKIFSKDVISEIDWLSRHIKSQGPLYLYVETLIGSIYKACIQNLNASSSS
ncbi:TPA: hypothetical protein ACGZ5C_002175 [Citrobacter freundii]